MSSFNDDEEIIADVAGSNSGGRAPFLEGIVQVKPTKKNEAPLKETSFTVLLEVTAAGSGDEKQYAGVDIVTVLDVSGSMGDGGKLEQLKTAMRFLIKKLRPVDRLSLVTFSSAAARLCPLRNITEGSQNDMEALVEGLHAHGGTNISGGLETALKVIGERRFSAGREVAVMLMSDGEQGSRYRDAATVPVDQVPVYTFGFGAGAEGGYDPTVLNAIASNSKGGTFSLADAANSVASDLSTVFSQCLGGLLTTVVQDLKLKVKKIKSKIQEVSAGSYKQTRDDAEGSVTIDFGNLYLKEKRNFMVQLVLPAVPARTGANILEYSYSYVAKDGEYESPPLNVRITRVETTTEKEVPEVVAESTRLGTAQTMKQARVLADNKKLEDAKDKLVDGQGALDDVEQQDEAVVRELVEALRYELGQLLGFMKTQELYDKQGRAFALSSETSHAKQRFAARGDVEKMRLFSTPRMGEYLRQAKQFQEDPSIEVPSADQDVQQEAKADPLAQVIGPLSYHLEAAIQALKAIQDILNASRGA